MTPVPSANAEAYQLAHSNWDARVYRHKEARVRAVVVVCEVFDFHDVDDAGDRDRLDALRKVFDSRSRRRRRSRQNMPKRAPVQVSTRAWQKCSGFGYQMCGCGVGGGDA